MQKLGDYIKEYSARNKLDEEIPVYSVTNSNGFCRDYFGKEVASNNKKTYKIVPRNAFAYNPSRINVGSVDYQHYEDRVIVSPLYNVFTVDEKILPQYLYFYLKSPNTMKRIRTVASGSVRDNLKLSMLCEFPIQVPSINRQQNIIEILEKTQRIINEKNDELEKLDILIKARFVEMFGSIDLAPQNKEWTKISDIGEVVSGSTPKTSIKEYWNGNICWITPAELSNMSGIIYDSKKKITERGKSSCSLRMMPSRTVILSSRAPIGKVALLGKEMCCNQGFKNIICNEKVAPEYLYYLLGYNTIFLNSLGRGATFKEISKKIVGEIKVPLPAKELQNQFAVFTRQVDKSKFVLSNELTMCDFYIRLIHDRVMHSCINLRVAQ